MSGQPFETSDHWSHNSNRKQFGKRFFATHPFTHSGIAEMAIYFGLAVPLSALVIAILFVIPGAVVSSIAPQLSSVVLWAGGGFWVGFLIWLWISMTLAGRSQQEKLTSDTELLALQAACIGITAVNYLFAAGRNQPELHTLYLIFEWSVIVFHIIYFLLCLSIWVRPPLRAVIVFILLFGLTVLHTVFFA